MTNFPQLDGKTVIVTGAARGLGRAFAEAVASAGATVVLADIEAGLGAEAEREMQAAGFKAYFYPVDIGDPASISTFAAAVGAAHPKIDGLVNNAAIATGIGGKTYDEIDIETWDRVFRVNVRGTWLMVKAIVPLMTGGGGIVNLASDTALWGAQNLLHYTSSKGAVIAMTRSLSREVGPQRISVNAIAPGIVRVWATEYVPQSRHDLYENGRAIPGAQHPEDVVGAVVFLLSDASRFITGQTIPVNGGFVLN
jgi:NAD(P)-dependent dehydrogenase (short-subunit alcohol dehydrogenase family)